MYGIWYPENGGALYCDLLGKGRDGTAILIQDVRTGFQVVRKTTTAVIDGLTLCRARDHPEYWHKTEHPRIPRMYAAEMDQDSNSVVLFSAYSNGGNLDEDAFRSSLLKQDQIYPEILIWRMLRDLLSAVNHIHRLKQTVCHADIHAGNILPHWEQDNKLPHYFLADFGRAISAHQLDFDVPHKPRSRDKLPTRIAQQLGFDIGGIAAVMLYLMTGQWPHWFIDVSSGGDGANNANQTQTPQPDSHGDRMEKNLSSALQSAAAHSPALHMVVRVMMEMDNTERQRRVEMSDLTWGRYDATMAYLQGEIDTALQKLEREADGKFTWQVSHPPLSPMLFDSADDLLEYATQESVPDGWKIVELNELVDACQPTQVFQT